jgi:hypothetical protein
MDAEKLEGRTRAVVDALKDWRRSVSDYTDNPQSD